ncbi:MAG: hypothetical protein IKT70_08650 [Clostridia bacterium]|nr:hypothetical protein [Clostridia bacterium]
MNLEEIKEKTVTLCAQIFESSGVDTDLLEYVDFVDDLGMDSITFITLIVEIEAAFDITVPDDLLLIENFKNMDDVIGVVFDQLSESV